MAVTRHNLTLPLSGKPSEQEPEFRKAIALEQKLADDNPAVVVFRMLLANSHTSLAYDLSMMGKPTEAEAEFRAAITIFGKVVDDDPKVLFHWKLLAQGLNRLKIFLKLGRPAEALDAYGRAFTLFEQLIKENPTEMDYPTQLAPIAVSRGAARAGLWATPPARRPTSGMH